MGLTEDQRLKRNAYQRKWREHNLDRVKFFRKRTYHRNADYYRAYSRGYYQDNREQVLQQQREQWPRRKDSARDRRIFKKYGITPDDWERMFEAQGRVCGACQGTEPGPKGWHVDHCHDTGVVRGLLCQNCNVGLGHAKHDPEILKRWALYLALS